MNRLQLWMEMQETLHLEQPTKNEELKNIIRNSKYNFLQVLCNNTQTKQMLIVFHSFHCVINSKFNLLFQ